MKKKNIIIIAIVVAVGLAAVIIALSGSKTSTFPQDYHIEDIASVNKVFIADKQDNHVLLTRDGETCDSPWTVDTGFTAEVGTGYPASQPMVDMLLETLHDMRIRQQVNRNAIPQVVKLLSARAVKVEVYQRDYRIRWFGDKMRLFPYEKKTTYYVGHETQDMMACHMFREGDKVPYIIHIPGFRGYLTPRFVANPTSWRSHNIVRWNVHRIDRVEMEIPAAPQESYAIVRNGEGFDFVLTQTQTRADHFDTARVAQMLSCFANLNFDEYASLVPHAEKDTSFAVGPGAILRITDTAGTTREVKTYRKYNNPDDIKAMPDTNLYQMFDLDRLYAIVDNRDTVLIQYYVFDNILQPASFFLK